MKIFGALLLVLSLSCVKKESCEEVAQRWLNKAAECGYTFLGEEDPTYLCVKYQKWEVEQMRRLADLNCVKLGDLGYRAARDLGQVE